MEGHSTMTWLISLGQCTQHAFIVHRHTFDCPPHTDNSQRFVIIRQEAPTERLNQLFYSSHQLLNLENLKAKSSYHSAECVIIKERIRVGGVYWVFIGSPSPDCALFDPKLSAWRQR